MTFRMNIKDATTTVVSPYQLALITTTFVSFCILYRVWPSYQSSSSSSPSSASASRRILTCECPSSTIAPPFACPRLQPAAVPVVPAVCSPPSTGGLIWRSCWEVAVVAAVVPPQIQELPPTTVPCWPVSPISATLCSIMFRLLLLLPLLLLAQLLFCLVAHVTPLRFPLFHALPPLILTTCLLLITIPMVSVCRKMF